MNCDKREALHYHAMLGSYLRVQSLINEGVDLDQKDQFGRTPLMFAAHGSHKEVVELLINSGADSHCCDNNGFTALHYASIQGSVEIVQCLMSKRVALDVKNLVGETPLMLATDWSHKGVVELLINSGSDIYCYDNGWTVLHEASFQGWVKIVQCLVNKGVSLNMKDLVGETPLIMAAKGSHKEVVELLINSGADSHCCDNNGYTALHYASLQGTLEIVHCLVSERVAIDINNLLGETPLMLATLSSHREVAELLINSGADIHWREDDGWTMLHYASFEGWVEIVQCLVNKGIDPDGKTSDGRISLMMAAQESHREVVELLILLGADIHCCENDGSTVLHHACYLNGSVEIVQYLVNKGVALNVKNSKGQTPLHLAVKRSGMEIADYLLKAGADCNLEDNEGESPFNFLITEKRHVETIKLCIEKGAHVKYTDYIKLLADSKLLNVILQDVKLCTQAVINKFNNKDLPLFYKGLASTQNLPRIDKMKIGSRSGMALQVEQAIAHEIQAKGFCNLFEVVPLVLGMLCVKCFIEK